MRGYRPRRTKSAGRRSFFLSSSAMGEKSATGPTCRVSPGPPRFSSWLAPTASKYPSSRTNPSTCRHRRTPTTTDTGRRVRMDTVVDFYFDPMCPFAYQTSLWIRDVREQVGIGVDWRFFSLEEINRAEGKKHPWEREWSYGWSLMRIGALLRRADPGLLDRWYLAAGTALHVEGRKPHRREVAGELLRQLDLDPGLVGQAIDDPSTTQEVR